MTSFFAKSHHLSGNEEGGVMIIFTLALVVILGVVGIAVDTTIIANSRAQLQHSAEFAVLQALKAYMKDVKTSRTTAIDNAVLAAREVLGGNAQRNVGRIFFREDLVTTPQNIIGANAGTYNSAPDKINGELRPIKWYFPAPPTCIAGNRDGVPCAVAKGVNIDPVGVDGNAIELTYKTAATSPINFFLGRLFGRDSVELVTKVRATISQRNAVALIDLSGSITSDTHKSRISAGCPADLIGRSYAYEVQDGATCFDPSTDQQYTTLYGTNAYGSRRNWLRCVRAGEPTASPDATPPSIEPDYGCYTFRSEYTDGTSKVVKFQVDESTAPQPLTAVLKGINQAMSNFEARSVPGDSFALIAFDTEFLKNRILAKDRPTPPPLPALPAPLDGLADQPYEAVEIGSPEFNLFKNATNTTNALSHISRVETYLIPRERTKNLIDSPATDLPTAMTMAKDIITRIPGYSSAQNFVLAFSDGKTNCRAAGDCQSNHAYWVDSNALVEGLLTGDYTTEKIAFNLFLFGDSVAPHYLAWDGGGTGTCATVEQISALGKPITDISGGSTYDSNPFYGPNGLATKVMETGGLFAPIRPCYKLTGGPNTGQCRALYDSEVMTETGKDFHLLCRGIDNDTPDWSTGSPFWDAKGRITYDINGETQEQQVSRYINQILSKNPFILVECTNPADCA